jgi:hypothetical protein
VSLCPILVSHSYDLETLKLDETGVVHIGIWKRESCNVQDMNLIRLVHHIYLSYVYLVHVRHCLF